LARKKEFVLLKQLLEAGTSIGGLLNWQCFMSTFCWARKIAISM
jgi:hypothetical protein